MQEHASYFHMPTCTLSAILFFFFFSISEHIEVLYSLSVAALYPITWMVWSLFNKLHGREMGGLSE